MKNYGTIDEVMSAYVKGEKGPHSNYQRNIFFKDNIIYSYGTHFPLAMKLKCGTYLINGDHYSVTTSKHQSKIRHIIIGGWGRQKDLNENFTTSWSALRRTDAKPDGSNIILVDKRPDLHKSGEDAKKWLKENPDDRGGITFHYDRLGELSWIHRPGSTLLRINRKYWICGMDENSYFVSRLPRRCYTVSDAFNMLKPDEVKQYEKEKDVQVPRQGEWFFLDLCLPASEAKKEYKNMEQKYILPRELGGNPHTATRGMKKKKDIFISGQVRHPEHRMARLSTLKDIKVFQAYENTAKESYSAEGRVD